MRSGKNGGIGYLTMYIRCKSHKIIEEKYYDKILSFAVAANPLVAVVQEMLLNILYVAESFSTAFRVVSTAVLFVPAIFVCIRRNSILFFFTYLIAAFLIACTIIFFPQNIPPLLYEAFRFFFPTVLPTFISIACISNIEVFENIFYKTSKIVFLLMIMYVISVVLGYGNLSGYNMNLSYSLLLPAASLYSRKKIESIVASIILYIIIIVAGSRGAVLAFGIYILGDIILFNKKNFIIVIPIVSLFLLNLADIVEWLAGLGITSRTINMALEGNISSSSGRDVIAETSLRLLSNNPLIGLGLWGDRLYAAYAHNIFLEIYVDFGYLLGSFIIVALLIFISYIFVKSTRCNKRILFKYLCVIMVPLQLSHSYLLHIEFAILMGISVLLYKELKNNNNKEVWIHDRVYEP